jgi:hypothetical protein
MGWRYEPEDGLFKSNQHRICAMCLGTIKPKDMCGYVFDEIACNECWNYKEIVPEPPGTSSKDPHPLDGDDSPVLLTPEDKRMIREV